MQLFHIDSTEEFPVVYKYFLSFIFLRLTEHASLTGWAELLVQSQRCKTVLLVMERAVNASPGKFSGHHYLNIFPTCPNSVLTFS